MLVHYPAVLRSAGKIAVVVKAGYDRLNAAARACTRDQLGRCNACDVDLKIPGGIPDQIGVGCLGND